MAESSNNLLQRTVSTWWSWIRQKSKEPLREASSSVKRRRRRLLPAAVSMFDVGGTHRETVTSAQVNGLASSCLVLERSPVKRSGTTKRRDVTRSCYELGDGETRAYCETHFPALHPALDAIDPGEVRRINYS